MRILHLVAADRWTGAAATALQAVEALREAGHDARLAYRGGRNLEERLEGLAWAVPLLAKERSLADVRSAITAVREAAEPVDLVHAHLPHDHALARMALAADGPPLVRSIHHPSHLRADPFHRWLFRGCAGVGLANSAMREAAARLPALKARPRAVLPVALERRFRPGGDRGITRRELAIPDDAVVAGTIGKLDRARGHDLFVRAVAATPEIWGMIIGKGPFQASLRQLARRLEVADRIVFAGYVEEGLEDLYAAMDLFVFPAAGSDWAHRAAAEASACGLPTLAADLDGIGDLVERGVTGDLYPRHDAAALAVQLHRWSADHDRRAGASRAAAERAAREWTPESLAAVLEGLYSQVLAARPVTR